jgi:iron(III) transport system permease protein
MRTDWKTWLLLGLVLVFFGLFLFYPLGNIVNSALRLTRAPTLLFVENALKTAWDQGWLTNALLVALATTAAASVLALPLAYVQARTAFFGKRLLAAAILAPMILPPFVGAIGLAQVLGPQGALNTALAALGLSDPKAPVDWFRAYPLAGVVLLQALHLYPVLYLNLVAGLANVDPSLEDAARNVGAGPWRVFWRVTFPLVTPAYFAGAILVFIWALTDLGTPLMFDFREVIAVQVYERRTQPDSPDSDALVLILLTGVAGLYLAARALFGRRAFGMMAVATRQAEPERLGPGRTALAWTLFGGVTLLAVVPHLSVVLFSFKTAWRGTVLPEGYTLAHHAAALWDAKWSQWTLPSIWNSALYSLGASAVALVLAVWIGYVLVRKTFPGRGLLDATVMLPLALPGIVLAFGYLNAYADWGDRLVAAGLWDRNYLYPQDNPVGLLVIAYAVRRLPLAVRSSAAGFQQTSRTLEEAALSVGAGPARTVWRITLPLIFANLAAGAILVFSMSMLEVSDSLILVQDNRFNPITRTIYQLFSNAYEVTNQEVASAMGVWAMALLAAALGAATLLMGKRLGAIFRA